MKKFLAIIAGIFAVILAFLTGRFFKSLGGRKADGLNTAQIKEEVKLEIQNTPAGDLVAAAPDADRLRTDAAGIAEQAKQRLRDRAGKILSGYSGSGTDGDGGIRD